MVRNRSARVTLGLLVSGAAAIAWSTAARADVFYLQHGGEVRGVQLNRREAPLKQYRIQTDDGAQITLERAQVERVERQPEALAEYERQRIEFPDTAEGHWALAEWCKEHKLDALLKSHLERVIEIDANHAGARRLLDYRIVDGRWKTQDEIMADRGFVRDGGSYKTPQQLEIEQRKEKTKQAEQEWVNRIKRWRQELQDPAKHQIAADKLRSIDDPFALKALHQWLRDEPAPFDRDCIAESLARIPSPDATQLLVGLAMEDDADDVRTLAIESLSGERRAAALPQFVRGLKSKNNEFVNRAGAALGKLGDGDSVGPLIDALVTTHKFQVTTGAPGGMGQTFARPDANGVIQNAPPGMQNGAGGSFSFGSSTKIVKEQIRNRDVLDALVRLTKTNFEFDANSWKRWHATQKKSEAQANARRN